MPDAPIRIEFDSATCSRCGLCLGDCPARILGRDADRLPHLIDGRGGECILCGHCVAVCRTDSVAHSAVPMEGTPEVGSPPSPEEALRWLRQRRSVRNYKKKDVPRELLESLLAAARYAPSAKNLQDPRYTVLTDRERIGAVQQRVLAFFSQLVERVQSPIGRQILRLLAGRRAVAQLQENLPSFEEGRKRLEAGEDPLLHQAPALIAVHAHRHADLGAWDCAIAADHLTLYAPSLGLGTCLIGFLIPPATHDAKVRDLLGLPKDHVLHAALTVGFPAVAYHRTPERPAPKVTWVP